jgi:hypothetical protein
LIREPGEELDHGDAGIAEVVVGPLRAVAGNAEATFFYEIIKGTIVEIRGGQFG